MCGIAGIVNVDSDHAVDYGLLEQMCSAIRHRGPDDLGIWVNGSVGIGMTRLSVIDVSAGHQPMHNEDKTLWIVFNGEIYNYRELREGLITRGHRFLTNTDTEVILHLYEDHKEDCVQHLRGMFAFAIWNIKDQELFIARDRLGIKPLYYFFDGKRFVFGSEAKAVLQCPDIPREPYAPALVNYFFYGYVPDPQTSFSGLSKLPAAHYLTYRAGKVLTRRYWDVQYNSDTVHSEEYYIERLIEILDESVRIHLVSDVPLGAFLSGGIDSGLVVALMSRHVTEPVKTFSIGFAEQAYDELPYARKVAQRYQTDHHEEIVNPDAESLIKDLVRQFDEPFADSSAIPTYYVSRLARKHVKVALSGDGGDELFGGYTHYLDGAVVRYSRWIPKPVRQHLLFPLSKRLPDMFPGANTLRHISCSEEQRIVRKYTRHLSTFHEQIFSPELTERITTTDPSPLIHDLLRTTQGKHQLTRLQHIDLNTYLPGDILTKVDRTSMLVSLEARVPILDHRVAEFAGTIPPALQMRGLTTKYLLRKVAERFLPKELIDRPKHGFALPIQHWTKREWHDLSHELILGQRALARGNYNVDFLRRIYLEHTWGRRNHAHTLWTLMMLELWYREKID